MAFTSKSQIFPFGMFPDPATQQADVYKQVAPGFQDSPLVNQFLSTATPRPQMGPPRPQMGPPKPTTTPTDKDKSGLAYMLIALGGALRGDKNFIQNTMAIKDAQTEKERREAQKKRYDELLKEMDPESDLYTLAKSLGPEDLRTVAVESFRVSGAKSKAQADLLSKLAEEERAEKRTLEKEERAEKRTLEKEGRAEKRTLEKEGRAEARQIEKEERAEARKKITKSDIEAKLITKILSGEELTADEREALDELQRLDPIEQRIRKAMGGQPQQTATTMQTFPSLQAAQAAGLKKGDRFMGTNGQIYQVP